MSHENSLTQSRVLSRIQHLLESGLLSDVTFLVGRNEEESSERIAAHKCILGSASPVFERMFTGDFKESRKEGNNELVIEVPDVTPSGFREFLRWVYTDEVTLSLENVAPLLYSAEKYDLSTLVDKCNSFMRNVSEEDRCSLFYQCKLQGVLHLVPWIKDLILLNASSSLTFDSVLGIKDNAALNDLLSSNGLKMKEIDVFRTALHWASSMRNEKEEDLREILGPVLHSIRFPLLSPHEFVDEVVPLKLLNDEETIDVLRFISKTKSNVSTGFSIQRRELLYVSRFEDLDAKLLKTLSHSIRFRVDKPISIQGLRIYSSFDEDLLVTGIMRLERVDPILKEEEKSVASATFIARSWRNYFDEPVAIDPKTLYRVCLLYDESSFGRCVESGTKGQKIVMKEGVHFEFEDDPDGNDNGSSVDEGQIPQILFSRLGPVKQS